MIKIIESPELKKALNKDTKLTRPVTVQNDIGEEVPNTGRYGVPVTFIDADGNTITDQELARIPADKRPDPYAPAPAPAA